MPDLVVIDTNVLQKANAPLNQRARPDSKFARRLHLLQRLQQRRLTALISRRLLAEYRQQVPEPRNDFVRAFFELLTNGGATANYCRWTGQRRNDARHCRFPREHYHVLRTAICDARSTILTEEDRMLATDACIHRRLRVHVQDPTA